MIFKKHNKENAKFFCENCGMEVPPQAKVCNNCGKFFASVRCPRCGKIGSVSQFEKGCPECGYAVHNKNNKHVGNAALHYINTGHGTAVAKSDVSSGLPLWIYIMTITILAILVVGLYSCLRV